MKCGNFCKLNLHLHREADMRKLISIIIMLLTFISVFAYEWSLVGPTGINVLNYCFTANPLWEIICTDEGFMSRQGEDWVLHSYSGLPVCAVLSDPSGEGDLLVALGDGSDSDGVYRYTFDNDSFSVLAWMMYPKFLLQHVSTGKYYCGGLEGLWVSEDGQEWQVIPCFAGMECTAMAYWGDHLVVATIDAIQYSDDMGESWFPAQSMLWLSDLCFDSEGKLYGVFPDMSWSSGLWSSDDFGNYWDIEFWDVMLSSVFCGFDGGMFIGWEEPFNNQGIATWDPVEEYLEFYNNGIPCLNINKITFNPLINCLNILVCTDQGAGMLTGFAVSSTENIVPPKETKLTNYPNPFNPETRIDYILPAGTDAAFLSIFNIRGQLVFSQQINSTLNSVLWHGLDDNNNTVPSGIYFGRLSWGKESISTKMLLCK